MVVMANKLVEPTAGDENFIFRILIKESEQMKGWIWMLRNLQQFKGKKNKYRKWYSEKKREEEA